MLDNFLGDGLLTDLAALAAVAILGFLLGRRARRGAAAGGDVNLLIELGRGQSVGRELAIAARTLRSETAAFLRDVHAFQVDVGRMQRGATSASWQKLRDQCDALLGPSMKLTTTLSHVADSLRQHQAQLMTYAATRTDAATGLQNRRSMNEHLDALLTAQVEGDRRLSVALFSVPQSPAADDLTTKEDLQALARLLEQCVRENDVVARYSQDEFIVLMPKTPLEGAVVFAERLVRLVDDEISGRLWGGLVEAQPGEPSSRLLSRADSALYSARTHDESCLFLHNGTSIRRHLIDTKPGYLTAVEGERAVALTE